MALMEAKRKDITPFCLTVDKAGHDYLKTMCSNMSYEALGDISVLPVLTVLAPSERYYQRLG
jgi:hypothetical protein